MIRHRPESIDRLTRHFGQPPTKKRGSQDQGVDNPSLRVPANRLYHPAQIISALERSRGMVTVAARLLNCSRQTIYNAAKAYPEVASVIEDQRELMLDMAELSLFNAVMKGQAWAVCFFLKTQGRKRGYVERVNHAADAATLEDLVLEAHRNIQKEQQGLCPPTPPPR